MLWASVFLPQLPLESVFSEAGSATPQALFDGPAQRPLIAAANASASRHGVRCGQSLAAAQAAAAQLKVRRRQPRAEAAQLQTLAAWAYGYSSQVVLLPPQTLGLEVGASLRLFGGWPRLEAQLRQGLTALNHQFHLCVAPSLSGAALLAAAGVDLALDQPEPLRRALSRLDLERCGLPERQTAALKSVGWRRLGDLLRAPPSELARRFGAELPVWIERALGQAPDPHPLFRPADRFERQFEFDHAIETLETLNFPLQRLCRELAAYLSARDGGVQQFQLICGHDDVPATPIDVGLRRAQREVQSLFEAARGRLEHSPLPAAVRRLALQAEHLPPFIPERRDLFDRSSRGELDWPHLAERLRARLGDAAVRGLALQDEHRPERAWRIDAAADAPAQTSKRKAAGGSGTGPDSRPVRDAEGGGPRPALQSPRPLWLLPQPQTLRQPVLRLLTSIERIETGWWDGDDVRRDYVIAELADGQRAWLFREAGGEGPWCLHGWFA